ISNTNKKRSLGESKYNERRRECENGLEILRTAMPNLCCLGDASLEDLYNNKHLFKNETIYRRVLHVISEDDRVIQSVKTLEQNDIAVFGRLMIESHESLRINYEVTGKELDT